MDLFNSDVNGFNEKEKEQIVKDYLPKLKSWVIRAKARFPGVVDIDELHSAASFGFIECLERFDKSRNVSFATYAEHRVKGSILDALRRLDHLSRTARSKLKQVEAAFEALKVSLGRDVTPHDVASSMNMTVEEIYKILEFKSVGTLVSLDEPIVEDGESSLIDFIKSEIPNPEEALLKKSLLNSLTLAIDNLGEKERLVITLYYYEELTMKEIAEILEISESRVSQIHSQAVRKMKKTLKDSYYD